MPERGRQFYPPVCLKAAIVAGFVCFQCNSRLAAQDAIAGLELKPDLRELIVSHADSSNTLQLYSMQEDGTAKRQLTDGSIDCIHPAWSPDGEKVVYVQQHEKGMALWLTDPQGNESRLLTEAGNNLLPSWAPDSKHIVWMFTEGGEDPTRNSQLRIMNTETLESRRLFSDPEQMAFSNSMPVVSPNGSKVAFVSNRSGGFRIWVSNLDGSQAKPISPVVTAYSEAINAPIEQKVPAWSPDGKWIAHWEGVEMVHLSRFTGEQNPQRDELISESWHVWVVGSDGRNKRRAGRGDDPTWSPDGFVTRSFPDPSKGGPKVMLETEQGWKELDIVPPNTRYARFTWKP